MDREHRHRGSQVNAHGIGLQDFCSSGSKHCYKLWMPDNQADSELNRELREAPEAIQAPGELAGRREVRSYGSLQLGILGMGMG